METPCGCSILKGLAINADSSNQKAANGSGSQRAFATTSWSLVLEATQASSPEAVAALSQLCQVYWFPLYTFLRRKGVARVEAEDLTQAFFAELLEKDRLQQADPERGRFRSFLLTSMSNFFSNHRRDQSRLKRGGGQSPIRLDFENADNRFNELASDEMTPERSFQRQWALSVLTQTLEAVSVQYQESGKAELFEQLQPFLTGDDQVPYRELANSTGMKEGAIKVAVHRLRQRYGQQLRLQISKTVADPNEVEQELRDLFEALG
ncbi:MAG: sigma-70 family RNA polymerase sigma factor [Planctomycetota bacterium]